MPTDYYGDPDDFPTLRHRDSYPSPPPSVVEDIQPNLLVTNHKPTTQKLQTLQVNSVSPSKRCEICHQDDFFDSVTNTCRRCKKTLVGQEYIDAGRANWDNYLSIQDKAQHALNLAQAKQTEKRFAKLFVRYMKCYQGVGWEILKGQIPDGSLPGICDLLKAEVKKQMNRKENICFNRQKWLVPIGTWTLIISLIVLVIAILCGIPENGPGRYSFVPIVNALYSFGFVWCVELVPYLILVKRLSIDIVRMQYFVDTCDLHRQISPDYFPDDAVNARLKKIAENLFVNS